MVLIDYIKERVTTKNKNFVMLVVGATGSGKSYSALRLAELLDPQFDINSVCFKAKDFMNTINGLVDRATKGEVIKGRVILWDEFGVEHNAREFMTISNRVINYFFQTSRHLNLVVIMTVPLLSFIDSATRKLCHCIGEMQGINSHDKTSTLKIKMLQVNVMTGKEYPKYMRYRSAHRQRVEKKIKLTLPSSKLLEDYEKKKLEFTRKLNLEIMSKLEKKNKDEVLADAQKDIYETWLKFDQDYRKVAQFFQINLQGVYRAIRKAKMKGLEANSSFRPIPLPVQA